MSAAVSTAVPTAELAPVCPLTSLAVERGAAALVAVDGTPVQVALFRLHDDAVLAVQQADPFSGANVLARGLVGTRSGEPTVASPVYKQVFSLRTGRCLETMGYQPVAGHGPDLTTYEVAVRDGVVHVGAPHAPGHGTGHDAAGETA
ncbi:nitrite reductase small subunit NirD [Xylanimonas protaetiae]|uniref:Nitrite reductase small subunit NirD n=1 Tax=Xylanimonas protaetiae TaxID=2509457 RepID=A0A4P6FK51_9MICO|nr:nitrite reductase small subunit NirD [Xylanimonas protaetiae]QAY70998.1 nitrite reductase small subunit NirD [Xylanimonas protaetiae]